MLEFVNNREDINEFISNSWRPAGWDKEGQKAFDHKGELILNAMLSRDQWEKLDAEVIARARQKFSAWTDLTSRGLTSETTLAEWLSSWRVGSERVEAEINMDFESGNNQDKTDAKRYSVPIPLISTGFSFGRREILTAKASGHPLDTWEAGEAADAVAEKAEELLISGDTGTVLEGSDIPGLTTLTARFTDTGADFGTLSNVYPTFTSMLSDMHANRYFGKFGVYLNPTQYMEMLDYISSTDSTALERVLALPQIEYVEMNDLVTAGEMVAVQLDKKALDIREALPLQVRRWEDPSGNRIHFKVLMAAVPRLRTDYAGNAGIAHISSI